MKLVVDESLHALLDLVTGRPGQPARPASVLIAEVRQEDFDGGRPRLRESDLRSPEEFDARFRELLASGFAWVNMSYCGVLRGHGLVLVEHARDVAHARGATSVNFSGPPKLVVDAGWDALAYVSVTQ